MSAHQICFDDVYKGFRILRNKKEGLKPTASSTVNSHMPEQIGHVKFQASSNGFESADPWNVPKGRRMAHPYIDDLVGWNDKGLCEK